jgi:hypothetical protein
LRGLKAVVVNIGVTGGAARDAPDFDSTLVPVVVDGTMMSKH